VTVKELIQELQKFTPTCKVELQMCAESGIARRKAKPRDMKNGWPTSPVGTWQVTTEGDCEGRTVKNLGVYKGHVADIAAMLADKTCYSLRFSPAQDPVVVQDNGKAISVALSLDIESGTWDIHGDQRADAIRAWLLRAPSTREYEVGAGTYYAAVSLKLHKVK
jgi:hypothetical protein